ncbi:MAG: hypothetical protein U1E29_07205 [Coriobacteriia bacterium]|nr:hypothetical protein [Coriobacteriia bacterium]
MVRTYRITLVLAILAASLIAVAGCGGPTLSEEFTGHFEEQGVSVDKIDVTGSPHEAQVMMDLMILNSHGIDTSNIMDSELVHATVKLENGEELTAVKYKGEIYNYKAE